MIRCYFLNYVMKRELLQAGKASESFLYLGHESSTIKFIQIVNKKHISDNKRLETLWESLKQAN